MTDAREKSRERQSHHHRKVEKDRGRRGAGEAIHDVEHTAVKRHDGDQEQIWKRDSRQLDCEPALLGIFGEAGCQQTHGLRRENPGQGQQNELGQEKQREYPVGE